MILKPIKDIDLFTQKSENIIGVFGSKKWLSVYGDNLNLVGIYKDEQQLIGGFFYIIVKKNGFDFVKLPPYTPHCGLFFVSESKNQASSNSFSKDVMSEVCYYFLKQKPSLTVLAFPSLIKDFQPFIWNKFKVIPNYTYRIKLDNSLDEIKNNFDSKNRNLINKAIKDSVLVTENLLSDIDLFNFFTNSLNNAGANVYLNELKNIFLNFSCSENSFSFTAKKDSEILGNVFCIYDKHVCYYLLGGTNKKSGFQGVNNLLVQKCIEKAKELGCNTFDFEGSMIKGVEKFFRGFGGELVPYYTVNKASFWLEMLLKFKKREIF